MDHSVRDTNLPVFYPPPRLTTLIDLPVLADHIITSDNVKRRSDLEQAGFQARRRSVIELTPPSRPKTVDTIVEMKMTDALGDIEFYDCVVNVPQLDMDSNRTGNPCAQYPIHDVEWRSDVYVHVETQRYYDYVRSMSDYSRSLLAEVIRLGNSMVVRAGGYRLEAMEMQELNCRRQDYAVGQLRKHSFVSPAIAPQLIDICRMGVVPEYHGPPPPDRRVTRYPYVSEDTEK